MGIRDLYRACTCLQANLFSINGRRAWDFSLRHHSTQIPESSRLSRMLLPTKKAARSVQKTNNKSAEGKAQYTTTDVLTKAGYIFQSSVGIYTLMPMAQRVLSKIIRIVDEEMQRVGGQKLQMPTLLTPEHWIKTGRWESTGAELFSFKDRKDATMILAPTHEEEITATVKDMVRGYRQLPLRLYQTTRKFRDEARARSGLLRAREFIMKDLYSFDMTKEQAIATFEAMEYAYRRCFDRIGVPYVVAEADSGNIGGSLSKEFHFISKAGEDTVLKCHGCGYVANEERARSTVCINDGVDVYDMVAKEGNQVLGKYRVAVPAGHEVSVLKIRQALAIGMRARLEITLSGTHSVDRVPEVFQKMATELYSTSDITCYIDRHSWKQMMANQSLETFDGYANSKGPVLGDWHVAKPGDICGKCGDGVLESQRAIEVGHIFHLGDKYSRAMDFKILYNGSRDYVQMGCYGIGVSRILQAAAECSNADGRGLRWPLAIAPYLAVIVPLDESDSATLDVHAALTNTSIDGEYIFKDNVAVDDRSYLSAGFRLYDAQLLGIPVTVVVGKRFVDTGEVEVQLRVPMLDLPQEIAGAAVKGDGYEHKAYIHFEKLGEFLAQALQSYPGIEGMIGS
ncbi:prolyl-tRNA synthetase [Coemansia reversa NRRL 1564]|uniref:proline--tRNA ligase n=1 Tax=Coemansia reversa (strain ATCC 12441 / NRRL 1564) TaxID=763665 RepID=A0A2G5BC07_COERN|nr:prolyl-tRNA synthetase [Coemansia reversa NRRL 1564]|eukprot:PIA16543.1 prolyl-tRNA synthetase [Coemansia reversa NRRL 1564]